MDAVLPSNSKPLADERRVRFVVKRTCEAVLVIFCILIAIRFSAKVPPANLGQSKWSQFYGMILSDSGNVALTFADDRLSAGKWATLGVSVSTFDPVQVSDFEVADLGAEIPLTFNCVRAP